MCINAIETYACVSPDCDLHSSKLSRNLSVVFVASSNHGSKSECSLSSFEIPS